MANGGHWSGIEHAVHDDPVLRTLPADTRLLYIALFSVRGNTAVPGLILAWREGLVRSLGLDFEVFDSRMAELSRVGLVHFDWETGVCYLPAKARMHCNAATSIWAAKHWRKVLNGAPRCALVDQAEQDALALLRGRVEASGGDKGKAILASYLAGKSVESRHADIVLNTCAPPAQQVLPFAWAPPPEAGQRPFLRSIDEVSPMSARHASPSTSIEDAASPAVPEPMADDNAPPSPDDNAVAAFQQVLQGSEGPEVLGLARVYASDGTGLPGHAATLWCHHWFLLRRERPETTLRSARLLGEHGRAGAWEGLRTPWQALCKSASGLSAMLDAAELWERRGRPSLRKGDPRPTRAAGDTIINEVMRASREAR